MQDGTLGTNHRQTLQVPGVAGPHICALEVVSEDLPMILPAIDHVCQ
jgi:hypothetical protein